MFIDNKIRNIGIFAHVDAGKTTLTENLLYKCGSIRKLGRVDEGTAHTDSMEVERERGISVRSAAASINWKDVRINIIDTPGHVDFSAEVERALQVLDGAVLVISAAEGVQSQTEVIWRALRDMKIPTIIFINKVDRLGADIGRVLGQIHASMTEKVVPVQSIIGEGEREPVLHSFSDIPVNPLSGRIILELRDNICEKLSNYDTVLLEKLIYGEEVKVDEIGKILEDKTRESEIVPVFFGSALKGLGIPEILDGIINYLPGPVMEVREEPSGLAYKIEYDRVCGRMVHVRLYEGYVKVKGTVYNNTKGIEEKINRIRKFNGSRLEDVPVLKAGEIGVLCGLDGTRIGDALGRQGKVQRECSIALPTLTVQAYPQREEQLDDLVEALQRLEEEDPLLNVQWMPGERELHLHLMGIVQMEILTNILRSRFYLDATFEKPSVIYKETPAAAGIGFVDLHTPYFAALRMKVEPLPRGSGVIYESAYTTDFIFPKYQNEVEQTVPKVLREGVYGWEVTDVKVTLIGGRSIQLATKPSDFRAVTPIAVMDALKDAGTILLEPIQEFELKVSCEEAGIVIGELVSMRAVLEEQTAVGNDFIIKGIIPVATSLYYPARVASLSKGRGSFKTKFTGYKECPLELGRARQRKTVDPSNRELYLQSISRKNMRDHESSNSRNCAISGNDAKQN